MTKETHQEPSETGVPDTLTDDSVAEVVSEDEEGWEETVKVDFMTKDILKAQAASEKQEVLKGR